MSEVVQGAKSFSRTINILQLISDQAEPVNLAGLLKQCDLTRPTLYRVLAALEAEGLIVQRGDKCYQLGSRIISLAHRALAQNDIRTAARDTLEQLRDRLGETIHLAVRNRDELVYVDKIESREVVRMASTIGTRVPFHSSAVGKAFLGALAPIEAEQLIDLLPMAHITADSMVDRVKFKEYIQRVREQGYAFESEENEQGIVCFGAAILDAQKQPIASVSVSIPLFRLKSEHEFYWRELQQSCRDISKCFGYVA